MQPRIIPGPRPPGMRPSLAEILYDEIVPRLKVEDVYPAEAVSSRRGPYYRGRCPLHGGSDPNFSVNARTLSWTCFSHCGHGSVVSFINGGDIAHGARFIEIVVELGRRAGVPVVSELGAGPTAADRATMRRTSLLEAFCVLAGQALSLPTGASAIGYMHRRGFVGDGDALAALGVGVHPGTPGLSRSLRATGYELQTLGLTDSYWVGRVLIVWRDHHGRVATILGRSIDDREPRYVYLRGARRPPLFGIDAWSRRRTDTEIIVEGLMDALLLRQRGVTNVAPSAERRSTHSKQRSSKHPV